MRALRRVPRNASLLFVLLFMIVVGPLVPIEDTWFIVELMFNAILIAGVYSVRADKKHWGFIVLTVVTLAVRWGELLSGARGMDVTALAITVVWIGYAVSIIIAHLFRMREVTLDTILGAMVTYLLVAVAFMMMFQILETVSPGSFSGLPEEAIGNRNQLGNAMMYFSLVCITTMGFGDIVPSSDLAQPLAVIEGVFGQLYLAVMIARLVGLHISSSSASSD